MKPVLIGMAGKKGSGKDTAASFLAQEASDRNYTFAVNGFAWKLKLSACRLFHPECKLEFALEWADHIKSYGDISVGDDDECIAYVTGREFLQHYGTESHRNIFGKDFWIDQILPGGNQDLGMSGRQPLWWTKWEDPEKTWGQPYDVCVITDVRFPNEAKRILDLGGVVFELQRPELDSSDTHASETPLPRGYVTLEVPNDGDLDELDMRMRVLLRTLI